MEAESELLRTFGWSIDERRCHYDFPRVSLECRFLRIIALETSYRLRLVVGKLGNSSIRYNYSVFDAEDKVAIEGTMTVVVTQDGKTVAIPTALRKALEGEPD